MEQAAARLRKTFHYSQDASNASSTDSLPLALDEEEQESLIARLHALNRAQDKTYSRILLALLGLCGTPYAAALCRPQATTTTTLLCVLALSSLAASAWIMMVLPPGETGIAVVDAWVRGGGGRGEQRAPRLGDRVDRSPLEIYLAPLNLGLLGLCGVLGLLGTTTAAAPLWMAVLPGVAFAVLCAGKILMGSVDVGELERLRYGYKGA